MQNLSLCHSVSVCIILYSSSKWFLRVSKVFFAVNISLISNYLRFPLTREFEDLNIVLFCCFSLWLDKRGHVKVIKKVVILLK